MGSRPTTARPTTARPATSASRPTTRAGARPPTGNEEPVEGGFYLGSGHYPIHEADAEHDAEYCYGPEDDDDDDDDVFAFAPPGSGQGVETTANPGWQMHSPFSTEGPQSRFSQDTATPNAGSSICEGQELYVDEKYGAIYDSEGRMLRSPTLTSPGTHPSHASYNYSASDAHTAVGDANEPYGFDVSSPGPDGGITSRAGHSPGNSTGSTGDVHPIAHGSERNGPSRSFRQARADVKHKQSMSERLIGPQKDHEDGDVTLQGAVCDSFELLKTLDATRGARTVELELEEEEDSPYPEVRASVSNVDDPSMPTITFRSVVIGLQLTCLISATNTLLAMRNPPVQITGIIVQLLAHPLGKLLAAALPYRTFRLPRWLGGFQFSLNPGLWNIKEHTVVNIITSYGVNPPYPLPLLFTQDVPHFWNDPRPMIFSLLFICAPQLIGLALSGFCRSLLVRPASMIWPQNLATTTILNTLHAEDEPEDGSVKRLKFFIIVSAAAFVAYFFPGYLFMALSYLNWVCWIWPDNVPINTVFGVAHGLGASVLTLDWTQINFIGNPLINPWWAQVNIFSGFVIGIWIAAPALYFSNTWFTGYFPILSGAAYDRHGHVYDVQRVSLDHKSLDAQAYESYSPVYISAGLVVTYTAGFAILTAAIVHTALHHGKSLWYSFRFQGTEEDDIHSKLMRRYPQVPQWWNAGVFVVAFILCIVLVVCYDTGVPVWALALSILVPAFYLIPFGLIYAMTGLLLTVNLIAELLASYLLPHHPMAMMTFKTLSQHTMNGALLLMQDQKLGHYMKIPPRQIFGIQIASVLVNSLVQALTKDWMVRNIPKLCATDQPNKFTCNSVGVFYSASVIWGMIGPQRTFGEGSMYHPLCYGLLVGAIAPVIVWYLAQKFPLSRIKFVSLPIIFAGMNFAPPAQGINFTSWFAVGFLFQYVLRRKAFAWWTRYNFVAAGALDFGTILSSLVIFFALQLPKDGIDITWWGNEVFTKTADYKAEALYQPPAEGFGSLPKF